ncbi:MAG: YybH family protein [Croceivirga sp.]
MKKLVVLLFLVSVFTNAQESNDENIEAIKAILIAQKDAWNNYDIETFMESYWKSNDLAFYGSSGVVKGWQATLERYKKAYPSEAHFGTLDFVFNEIAPIDQGSYYVMGEYHLTRQVGDANGIFMLVLKRIGGEWKIIADTSASTD